jgi:undecaprenyl pyrophosphate synthase
MPKLESGVNLVIRASGLFRYSDLLIRHFRPLPITFIVTYSLLQFLP